MSPDVPDDLSSADEHFSDALEGQSEDAFEEALDSPARPHVAEQHVAAQRDQETAIETPVMTEIEETERDDWSTMTAKERCKAKKHRKDKALGMTSAAAATTLGFAAIAATSALAGESSSNQESTANPTEASLDTSEQRPKGKKGKKNKKTLLFSDDAEPTAKPAEDECLDVSQQKVPDALAAHRDSFAAELVDSTSASAQTDKGAGAGDFGVKVSNATPAPKHGDAAGAVETAAIADSHLNLGVEVSPTVHTDSKSPTAGQILQESGKNRETPGKAEESATLGKVSTSESGFVADDGRSMTDESGKVDKQLTWNTTDQLPAAATTEASRDESDPVLAAQNVTASEAVPDDLWSSTASRKKSKKKKKKAAVAARDETAEHQTVSPSALVPASQTSPRLDSVNESTEVTREHAIVVEPEAKTSAAPLSDIAGQDGTKETFGAIDKEATPPQESGRVTLRNGSPQPHEELSAQAAEKPESSVVREPREISQSGPAVTASAVEVAEDEPVAPASALDSSTVDPEYTSAMPVGSRKGNKKRRKS